VQKRMAGQTAEDIRDNIVKITDETGNCVGTGFFIHKEYCVTCHHNIYELDEIYVEREDNNIEGGQQTKSRYHAGWVEEFSDMQKDVAFLKVKSSNFKPLQYRRETYGNIPVAVRGFPLEDLYNFPDGIDERGKLRHVRERFRWKEMKIIASEEVEDKKRKWKIKPKVDVKVYAFDGKFSLGFSGAPVCYEHDWKVVGMFEAKDDNQGYIIPMNIVIENFEKTSKLPVSAPTYTLHTKKIIDVGNEYFNKEEYAKAIEQYDIILSDPNYGTALSNKGLALRYMGKYNEAIKCYNKAIEIEQNDDYAWKGKGSVLRDLGNYGDAIKCYNKAIEINPNYAEAWNSEGITFHNWGRYEDAIKCYNKAIEINPNYAEAWFNSARSKVRKGDIKNGLIDLQKAIEIDKIYIESAKQITSFVSIRNDEGFKALVRQ
jgi:tetratricopeptide (TPR) repeat protein